MIIGSQSSQCNEFSFYGGCWVRSSRSGAFGGGGGRCCKSEAAAQRDDSIITPPIQPNHLFPRCGGGSLRACGSVQQLYMWGA
jgi:hypothetical protein